MSYVNLILTDFVFRIPFCDFFVTFYVVHDTDENISSWYDFKVEQRFIYLAHINLPCNNDPIEFKVYTITICKLKQASSVSRLSIPQILKYKKMK